MISSHLHLSPTPPFDFAAAAFSHGWARLAPNAWDEAAGVLSRVERLDSSQAVDLRITGADDVQRPLVAIDVTSTTPLSAADRAEIEHKVGHMLRIDEDFSDFYALCAARGNRWAAIGGGLGRLLRSPTVWEDVVKTIATTNTQWSGTKAMTRAVCDALGEPFPGDPTRRAFPTPEAVAAAPPEALVAARFGYRAPYVAELARRVVSGELDLEGLSHGNLPTPELRRVLLDIKGVGPYAAATLLMLLGRYDALGYDTVLRDFVSRRYFAGERRPERELLAVYDDWGSWRYLAYWFEMWLDDPNA